MGTESEDDLLTAAEAAKALGVTPQQVRTHARKGKLKGLLIGRDWVFRRGDVKAFVPARRGRPSTTESDEK